MAESSLEELKRRIAAGEYRIDSRTLAETILTKLELIRRVARFLASEDEEPVGDRPGGARRSRTRPGSRSPRPLRGRRQHLS